MLSITRVYMTDQPSIHFEDFKQFLKRVWLRTLMFADRMAVARLAAELTDRGQYREAKIAIQGIDKSHTAKLRLLRRLSK